MIEGHATGQSTRAFAKAADAANDFFSETPTGLCLSSIGVGMYKGEPSEEGDRKWAESLRIAIRGGINVVDTAIRYRRTRSEKVLGGVLDEMIQSGEIERENVFVATKGGLLGLADRETPRDFIDSIIVRELGIDSAEVVMDLHCLHPRFIEYEFERSRRHMNLQTIDCYYLHNPEIALAVLDRNSFNQRFRALFEVLERKVENGSLRAYGIASWNGFRRRPGSKVRLGLDEIMAAAKDVCGEQHHLKYFEVPLSVGMPFTLTKPKTFESRSLFESASEIGLAVFSSASTYEGHLRVLFSMARLMRLAGAEDSALNFESHELSFPESENSMAQLFEVLLAARESKTDIERAVRDLSPSLDLYPAAANLVRSLPGVCSALVGMDEPSYAVDHSKIAQCARINTDNALALMNDLTLA